MICFVTYIELPATLQPTAPRELDSGIILAVVNLVLDLTRGNVADQLAELDRIAGAFDAFLRHYGHNTATLQSLQTTCVSARF